jgi:hypothetical protein
MTGLELSGWAQGVAPVAGAQVFLADGPAGVLRAVRLVAGLSLGL